MYECMHECAYVSQNVESKLCMSSAPIICLLQYEFQIHTAEYGNCKDGWLEISNVRRAVVPDEWPCGNKGRPYDGSFILHLQTEGGEGNTTTSKVRSNQHLRTNCTVQSTPSNKLYSPIDTLEKILDSSQSTQGGKGDDDPSLLPYMT